MPEEDLTSAVEVPGLSLLFVIGSLGRGGAERQMLVLAAGLQRRGHRVAIMVLDDEGDLTSEAQEQGIDLIRLYERRHLWSAPKVIRFVRGVRKFSPAVVHSYLPKDNARLALVRRFVRPAKIVWGIRASKMDWRKYGLRQTILWPLVTKLSKRADLIISNSWSGAQHHIDIGYPADRITVIPNGIDTEKFRPDKEGGLRFRLHHGIPVDAKVVGMLARFDPLKGQTDFPDILHKILESRPDAFGVIVGAHSESEKSEVLDRASESGVADRLAIIGSTQAPWDALNAFDVLVLPSVTESFPNVVGEALACNVPVAAYDVGDVARLLHGVYEVVPQGDATALSFIVLGLIDNRVMQSGRSLVVRSYSVDSLLNGSALQLAFVVRTSSLKQRPQF